MVNTSEGQSYRSRSTRIGWPKRALAPKVHKRSRLLSGAVAFSVAVIGVTVAGCAATGNQTDATASSTQESSSARAQELRDLYTAYIAALNAHDFDRMDQFVADEVAFGDQTLTRDEIIDILESITDAVPDFEWEIQRILVDGDRLSAHLIDTGTPTKEWNGAKPTGASFSVAELAIYRVVDGRFVEMFNIFDAAAVIQQLQEG